MPFQGIEMPPEDATQPQSYAVYRPSDDEARRMVQESDIGLVQTASKPQSPPDTENLIRQYQSQYSDPWAALGAARQDREQRGFADPMHANAEHALFVNATVKQWPHMWPLLAAAAPSYQGLKRLYNSLPSTYQQAMNVYTSRMGLDLSGGSEPSPEQLKWEMAPLTGQMPDSNPNHPLARLSQWLQMRGK